MISLRRLASPIARKRAAINSMASLDRVWLEILFCILTCLASFTCGILYAYIVKCQFL